MHVLKSCRLKKSPPEELSKVFLNHHSSNIMAPRRVGTYYDILRVTRRAQAMEVNRAYRKLALQLHPDKNLGSRNAVADMQEVKSLSLT
jgi:preprotein translocase subunit Sec63